MTNIENLLTKCALLLDLFPQLLLGMWGEYPGGVYQFRPLGGRLLYQGPL